MKLNPILKRELKVQTRGYGILVLLCSVNAVLFVISLLGILSMESRMRQSLEADYGSMLWIYGLMLLAAFLLMLIITPSLTSGSISGERQTKTLDVLLTTGMRPMEIILGKLEASFMTVFVTAVSAVPAIILPLIYGGPGIDELLLYFAAFFVSAFLCLSIGIFSGSWGSSPQKSTAISYALMLGFVLIPLILVLLLTPFTEFEGGNASILFLLCDPLITAIFIIIKQISGNETIEFILESINYAPSEAFLSAYIPLSLFLQFMIGTVFLILTKRRLSPRDRKLRLFRLKSSKEALPF